MQFDTVARIKVLRFKDNYFLNTFVGALNSFKPLKKKPRILVCPLDWGLGHATRCVPVIRCLQDAGAQVIVGADKGPLAFLQNEFPGIGHVRMPGYRFQYPGKGSMAARMLLSSPSILSGIRKENALLENVIDENGIDGVISDNRYGLWSDKVPSVIMTHQLFIRVNGILRPLQGLLLLMNRHYISRYMECWIPDWREEPNLSGELSHKRELSGNFYFIGPLSRFEGGNTSYNGEGQFPELFVMLSGPEPQRSILEDKIIRQLRDKKRKAVVIRGITHEPGYYKIGDTVTVYNHLDSGAIRKYLESASVIVCRPGYSTIMDLAAVGRTATVIPTPGQTEQEYLAAYLSEKNGFICRDQDDPDLLSQEEQTEKNLRTFSVKSNDYSVLRERIANLLVVCRGTK